MPAARPPERSSSPHSQADGPRSRPLRAQSTSPQGTASNAISSGKLSSIKAIGFDTFGTVVDWRGSLAEEGAAWGRTKNIHGVDWFRFADRWRDHYRPNMDKVRRGEFSWKTVDEMNRMALDEVLKEFGITSISAPEKDQWNQAWHRLKPWPDAVPGLTRLKKKYIIGPCSNGDVALLTRLRRMRDCPGIGSSAPICRNIINLTPKFT